MMNGEKNCAACALAFLRIVLGAWFLWAAYPKLNAHFIQEGIAGTLGFFAQNGAVGFYREFLAIAQTHAKVFGILVAGGELLTGIALVLGLFTPLASVAAILMCGNYLLATWRLGPASIGINLLIVALGISFLIGCAGRCCGLDAKFCKKCES